MYLAPAIAKLSPIGGHGLMLVVGVIEIIAGGLVAFKPRIGAYVVMAWLLAIIIAWFPMDLLAIGSTHFLAISGYQIGD